MDRTLPFHAQASPAEDNDLVARCVSGHRSAQRQLFELHKRRVYGIVVRILGPTPHVDDVVQDAFVNVFSRLSTFRGEASLSSWIDRCAVRAALNWLRSRRSRQHLELVADNVASDDPSAERRALAREAARHLYAVLEQLPAKQRTAFALFAIEGRSLIEVAGLMDATVVATKGRVWRARTFVEKRAKADPILAKYVASPSEQGTGGPS
jgi:RNA polymerase sigma-70 factor (ECF subfamily)